MIDSNGFRAAHSMRLRPTAAGAILLPFELAGLILSLVIGGPAALLTAAALTLLILAPLAAWLHARRLLVGSPYPQERLVGEGFAVEVPVTNRSRFFTAADLTVQIGGARVGRAAGHVPLLAPGETTRVAIPHRLLDRGRRDHIEVALSTAFPFGLVRCDLAFEVEADLLGLPRMGALGDVRLLPAEAARILASTERLRMGEEVLYSVREWREGESLRRVHWKLSARRDRTIVSEFRSENEPPVRILLSRFVARDQVGDRRHRSFERAVGLTATLVGYYIRRGRGVRLEIVGGQSPELLLHGRMGLRSALYTLALVESAESGDADPLEELQASAARARRKGESVIGIFTGGKPLAHPTDPELSLFDVDLPATDRLFKREAVSA